MREDKYRFVGGMSNYGDVYNEYILRHMDKEDLRKEIIKALSNYLPPQEKIKIE